MDQRALAGRPLAQGEQPFDWRLDHADFGNGAHYCFEVRPAAGEWKPFLFGVPSEERGRVISVLPGQPGQPPDRALVANPKAGPSADGSYWCWQLDNAATPAQSYFAYLAELPSHVAFGQADQGPQYQLALSEIASAET